MIERDRPAGTLRSSCPRHAAEACWEWHAGDSCSWTFTGPNRAWGGSTADSRWAKRVSSSSIGWLTTVSPSGSSVNCQMRELMVFITTSRGRGRNGGQRGGDGGGAVQHALGERGFVLQLVAALEPPGHGEIRDHQRRGRHRDQLHHQSARPKFHFMRHAASGSIAKM